MNTKKNLNEELLALTTALKSHLEFYKELGLTAIGSSSLQSNINKFVLQEKVKTTIYPKILDLEHMAKQSAPSTDQFSLFEMGNTEQSITKAQTTTIKKSLGKVTLAEVRAEVGHCCQLCPQAINIVFGEGNQNAELMFIGEAPGAEEDATGRPFVGAAGKLLDKIIAAIGLKREDIYITNVVKCRPPNNRKPTNEEMSACEPFLFNEIEIVKPKLIVTLGATPLASLLNIKEGITKTRGQFYNFHGIAVMPTFHPAFLLRVPERKREVWEDMKQVMAKLQEIRKENNSKT
jgi:DNA polymerase